MDTVFSNGTIIDGTGAARFTGDIRVTDGKIAWVGDGPRDGADFVDAAGEIIAPGFIDFHAHTDMSLLVNPTCESKISQGVTLEVNGNCGFSDAPVLDSDARQQAQKSFAKWGAEFNWSSMGEMLASLESAGTAVNFCTLVGHANLRRDVAGKQDRPASDEEIQRMQNMAAQAMDEGAVGLSTGLIYPPSCYGSIDEIARIATPVGKRGGIYATHMRSESAKILDSVRESIEVGERSGCKVQISHLKACGKSNYGKAVQALELIEEARCRGVDVTADQYPYIATCTGLDTMIPAWAHSGGVKAMRERLEDPTIRAKVKSEIEAELSPGGYLMDSGGFDTVVITGVTTDENRWTEGLSMTEIAKKKNEDRVDALIDFLLEEDFGVGMVHFCLSETDVHAVMKAPYTLFGSDATARAVSGPLASGKPHPRAFGTFPRILSHYVRDNKVISLELAIKKMTSLAAERLGIMDRGRIAAGFWADIVVFNPDTVRDTATFSDPKQLSVGISHVLVNGDYAVRNGKITGALPGQVIRST